MLLFEKVSDLKEFLLTQRELGKTVGFVPTMGALHNGHLSLIHRCSEENDLCISSIFVNPKQFNDKKDLENYPRDKSGDIQLLSSINCDVLFYPEVEEMYPSQKSESIDLGDIENLLEGSHRPGHFAGVTAVVKRFFEIITPDKAYFGLKDYQQFLVVSRLSQKLQLNVEVIGCETTREYDGLALSSRNRLLSKKGRVDAVLLYSSLTLAKELISNTSISTIKDKIDSSFEHSGIKLEYFEIVDANTLKKVVDVKKHKSIIACIAAYVDGIRLIDNLILIP